MTDEKTSPSEVSAAPETGGQPGLLREDEVIILAPGDEQAQHIARAISHANAGDVVELLQEGPLSLSDIAERLKVSVNSIKYHVMNLLDAGIVEVAQTKYSVKGRKVTYYRLKNQLLIIAPHARNRAELRSMLMRYAMMFGVYLGAFLITFAVIPGTWPLITGEPYPVTNIPVSGSWLPGSGDGSVSIPDVIPALVIAVLITLAVMLVHDGYIVYTRNRVLRHLQNE
jgi:DNA-binding transcriptional ArsR family regulator